MGNNFISSSGVGQTGSLTTRIGAYTFKRQGNSDASVTFRFTDGYGEQTGDDLTVTVSSSIVNVYTLAANNSYTIPSDAVGFEATVATAPVLWGKGGTPTSAGLKSGTKNPARVLPVGSVLLGGKLGG